MASFFAQHFSDLSHTLTAPAALLTGIVLLSLVRRRPRNAPWSAIPVEQRSSVQR